MFVCITVCMNARIYLGIMFIINTHVRIKIYREFYHGIIYIANGGRHVMVDFDGFHYPSCYVS